MNHLKLKNIAILIVFLFVSQRVFALVELFVPVMNSSQIEHSSSCAGIGIENAEISHKHRHLSLTHKSLKNHQLASMKIVNQFGSHPLTKLKCCDNGCHCCVGSCQLAVSMTVEIAVNALVELLYDNYTQLLDKNLIKSLFRPPIIS